MAIASSNKFPKVIYNISTGVAAASTGTYNSWMSTAGKLTVTSSGGVETIIGPNTSTGNTLPGSNWVSDLFVRPSTETAHTNDDEFTASSTLYVSYAPTGNATWTVAKHMLSVAYDSQSANDAAIYVKPLTSPAAPWTIETAMGWAAFDDTAFAGMCFTDGTTGTSNLIGVNIVPSISIEGLRVQIRHGTVTDVATAGVNKDMWRAQAFAGPSAYFRLSWTTTNTFAFSVSPDRVSWTDFAAGTVTDATTPAFAGFYVSRSGGGAEPFIANYQYLRNTTQDLSV